MKYFNLLNYTKFAINKFNFKEIATGITIFYKKEKIYFLIFDFLFQYLIIITISIFNSFIFIFYFRLFIFIISFLTLKLLLIIIFRPYKKTHDFFFIICEVNFYN
jgi:hypothetical protein